MKDLKMRRLFHSQSNAQLRKVMKHSLTREMRCMAYGLLVNRGYWKAGK